MQAQRLALVLSVMTLALAACGTSAAAPSGAPNSPSAVSASSVAPSAPASVAPSAPASAAAPSARTLAAAAQSASAPPSAPAPVNPAASISASPGTPQAAIQQVILRGNNEEVQAIQSGNPAVLQDTSTTAYYQDTAQAVQDMLANGIKNIRLDNLIWGPISVNGSTAVANTLETWTTQFSDGTVDQAQQRNLYGLVQDGGSWKIQSDEFPDTAFGPPPGPAGASPRPSSPAVPPAALLPSGQNASRNWAGYAATGGSYTAVTGTWNVPQLNPNGKPGADATWVGIGGVATTDLIQAGTQHTVLDSNVQYGAWIETLPQASHPVTLAIHPNDSITVDISQGQDGAWTVSLKNNTTGATYSRKVQYQSSLSSAEWIEEAPSTGRGAVLPLDDFGKIGFSNSTSQHTGKPATLTALGASAITMVSPSGQPLATPSAIQSNGTSFSVTRTSAVASPPPVQTAFPPGGSTGLLSS